MFPTLTRKALNFDQGQYIYMDDLIKLSQCDDSRSSPKWPVLPSPFNWKPVVESHTDKHVADYIFRGLVHGFRVGFVSRSKSLKAASKNHQPQLNSQLRVSILKLKFIWVD